MQTQLTPDTSGLILRFTMIGAGLRALSLVSQFEGLRVLCFFQNGPEFSIILNCETSREERALVPFFKEISNVGLWRSKRFSKWNTEVEQAFFKLKTASLSESCLIAESDDLGTLFQWGHEALAKGLQIVEFSFPRGSKPWGYLVLTGTKELTEVTSLKDCENLTRVEVTDTLKSYF